MLKQTFRSHAYLDYCTALCRQHVGLAHTSTFIHLQHKQKNLTNRRHDIGRKNKPIITTYKRNYVMNPEKCQARDLRMHIHETNTLSTIEQNDK